MEDFGLPTWGSYLIFAVATIFMGAILGLILVCVIDFIYPPKFNQKKVDIKTSKKPAKGEKTEDELVRF